MTAQPKRHRIGRSTGQEPSVPPLAVAETGRDASAQAAFDGSSRRHGSPTAVDESRAVDDLADLADSLMRDLLRAGLRLELMRPQLGAEGVELLAAAANDVDQAIRKVRCAVLAQVAARLHRRG